MTKTKVGQTDVKPTEVSPAPLYTAVHVTDCEQPGQKTNLPGTTCWYVFGILSTIFCCLPCGVVGMVHAMIARHEGERGNMATHRRRMYQAKCWTSWSIVLGLLTIIGVILYVIGVTIGFDRFYGWCGNIFYDDYGYGNDGYRRNYTQWNETYYYEDYADVPRMVN